MYCYRYLRNIYISLLLALGHCNIIKFAFANRFFHDSKLVRVSDAIDAIQRTSSVEYFKIICLMPSNEATRPGARRAVL